jgi:hypothetical protein
LKHGYNRVLFEAVYEKIWTRRHSFMSKLPRHALLGVHPLLPLWILLWPIDGVESLSNVRMVGVRVAATVLLVVASIGVARLAWILTILLQKKMSLHYQARDLTPEKIVGYRDLEQKPVTPELISRQIVERSEQIHRALLGDPSDTEVEMCALGYSICVGDFLVLLRLMNEQYSRCGPIRRLRLEAALRQAYDSLSRTRKVVRFSTSRRPQSGS